jgi:hypothetical protein
MGNQNVKVKDRQTFPFLMIPKVFFTRYNPSFRAILAYTALRYYASNEAGACEGISIKTLAGRAATSDDTFKRGLAELVKKGIVKSVKRSRKSPAGDRIPLPNLYELADLQPDGGGPI